MPQYLDHLQGLARTSEPICLSERQLAARWQSSQRTLQRWRASGKGPPFLRIGGLIRYPIAGVEAFEDARRSAPDGNGGG
jgi:hypothetical protein